MLNNARPAELRKPVQLDLFLTDTHTDEYHRVTPFLPPPKRKPSTLGEGQKRFIVLSDRRITYTLFRSRRRSIGFLIDEYGLRITAPKRTSIADIENAIWEKQKWIRTKLDEQKRLRQNAISYPLIWKDGVLIPYLGSSITLRLVKVDYLSLENLILNPLSSELFLHHAKSLSPSDIATQVKKWLKQEALRIFTTQMNHYATIMNVHYRSITLSSAQSRWGICTTTGDISLSWRLIHMIPSLIDYVIVHELAHLKEMNHSPRFWNIVASIIPNYLHARKQLNEQSIEITPLFS